MEEKNRRRNTGFVCFMKRDDAEEAMEACDDMDPFNNGRLLTLRWGKSVKKTRRDIDGPTNIPIRNTNKGHVENSNDGSRNTPALHKLDASCGEPTGRSEDVTHTYARQNPEMNHPMSQPKPYDKEIHASSAIRVDIPEDKSRFHFISITASYVAKDPEIEQRLKDEEVGNPLFSFLTHDTVREEDMKERIFYRWRVYSFCQGDTYSIWRTKPFLMFHNGRYWIPPPLDEDAMNREKASAAEKEHRIRQQKEDRANREFMTGRQFEIARNVRRKRRGEFGANQSRLNPNERHRFDQLVKKELTISRQTICRAMAFCFDNCAAARDVSTLLSQAIVEDSDHVTNDARIARLYDPSSSIKMYFIF